MLLQKPPHKFTKGCKLEASNDPLQPLYFGPATVKDTAEHLLKIHFDGWPEQIDYHYMWTSAFSPDIYPAGWAEMVGHCFQSQGTPVVKENLYYILKQEEAKVDEKAEASEVNAKVIENPKEGSDVMDMAGSKDGVQTETCSRTETTSELIQNKQNPQQNLHNIIQNPPENSQIIQKPQNTQAFQVIPTSQIKQEPQIQQETEIPQSFRTITEPQTKLGTQIKQEPLTPESERDARDLREETEFENDFHMHVDP